MKAEGREFELPSGAPSAKSAFLVWRTSVPILEVQYTRTNIPQSDENDISLNLGFYSKV